MIAAERSLSLADAAVILAAAGVVFLAFRAAGQLRSRHAFRPALTASSLRGDETIEALRRANPVPLDPDYGPACEHGCTAPAPSMLEEMFRRPTFFDQENEEMRSW